MNVQIILLDRDSEMTVEALLDNDNLADYDLSKNMARSSVMNDIESALNRLKEAVAEAFGKENA